MRNWHPCRLKKPPISLDPRAYEGQYGAREVSYKSSLKQRELHTNDSQADLARASVSYIKIFPRWAYVSFQAVSTRLCIWQMPASSKQREKPNVADWSPSTLRPFQPYFGTSILPFRENNSPFLVPLKFIRASAHRFLLKRKKADTFHERSNYCFQDETNRRRLFEVLGTFHRIVHGLEQSFNESLVKQGRS